MGRYLEPGHQYQDGQTISGASLTEHVADALLKATTISEQLLKDPAAATDELLINDSGQFKKITVQILKTLIAQTLTSDDLSDETRSELKTPVGVIVDFAGIIEPDGWLFCGGQAVSRMTYALLFDAIGTIWGEGDGSNTFNVPDLRGFVCAGKDDMVSGASGRLTAAYIYGGGGPTALGGYGGGQAHTLTSSELATHSHTFNDFYQGLVPGGAFSGGTGFTLTGEFTGNTTAAAGGGGAHNNVQPTRMLNKIIRAL